MCTIVREGESVSVSGERERITEHRREHAAAAEQTTQHAAEQRAAAAEQSTGAAMASRKHERSESR